MNSTLSRTTRVAVELAVVAGMLAAVSLPAFAQAALFAYVNQQGEVATVNADTWQAAIATAPNIDEHSGVMLLSNPNDGIVGDKVPVN